MKSRRRRFRSRRRIPGGRYGRLGYNVVGTLCGGLVALTEFAIVSATFLSDEGRRGLRTLSSHIWSLVQGLSARLKSPAQETELPDIASEKRERPTAPNATDPSDDRLEQLRLEFQAESDVALTNLLRTLRASIPPRRKTERYRETLLRELRKAIYGERGDQSGRSRRREDDSATRRTNRPLGSGTRGEG